MGGVDACMWENGLASAPPEGKKKEKARLVC
jgi:hypothetical protein